jgi:hypothetical protein
MMENDDAMATEDRMSRSATAMDLRGCEELVHLML